MSAGCSMRDAAQHTRFHKTAIWSFPAVKHQTPQFFT